MLGLDTLADALQIVHRDGGAGERRRIGIHRQKVALLASLDRRRFAVTGKEHEETILRCHRRELLVKNSFNARLRRLTI